MFLCTEPLDCNGVVTLVVTYEMNPFDGKKKKKKQENHQACLGCKNRESVIFILCT